MPVMNRPSLHTNNDNEHHKVFTSRQDKNDQNNDTSKNLVSLPTGSTVVVQQEDGGPWTHRTIEDKGYHNHHNRSYKVCITKTGRIVTCNRQHVRPTPIKAENFLHNQLNRHTKKRST